MQNQSDRKGVWHPPERTGAKPVRSRRGSPKSSNGNYTTTNVTAEAGVWRKPDCVMAKVTQGRQGSPPAVTLVMTILHQLIS